MYEGTIRQQDDGYTADWVCHQNGKEGKLGRWMNSGDEAQKDAENTIRWQQKSAF
jgi:hypothetical protein